MRLTGDAAPALLARVFAEVVRRHEALRTRFENRGGEPAQVIDRAVEPQLPLVDLSGLPGEVREERVRELAREHARRPFDLRRGPLLRLVLWRLLEGAAGVALAMEAAGTTVEPLWDQMLLVSAAGIAAGQAR